MASKSPNRLDPLITDKERVRRLVALPGVRPAYAERLAQARVAIVGMGGLGNPAALYLAAQGVGHLHIIDPDQIEGHNLGRQVLFSPHELGQDKVMVAQAKLSHTVPECEIVSHVAELDAANVDVLLDGVDLVIDGLDRANPRMVLNDWTVKTGRPVFFGGAIGYEAQVFGVQGGQPCLYCLFGDLDGADENCAVSGVLGPVVGMAAMVQASEALKILMGVGQTLVGRLWTYDAYALKTRIITVPPRDDCPRCTS